MKYLFKTLYALGVLRERPAGSVDLTPPIPEPVIITYNRPDGVSFYLRPDGVSTYLRP